MSFDLEESLAVLGRTPATLRALLADLPPAWLAADEGPGSWNPIGILGHLIHGEDTDWIARARVILEEGEARPFVPFDRQAQEERFRGAGLAELLERFAESRARSLETLRGWRLTEAKLALTGMHPEFGRVTLRQLIATWVVHDLGHLAQIARVMGKRYTDDVGPWKAYLPVLSDRASSSPPPSAAPRRRP